MLEDVGRGDSTPGALSKALSAGVVEVPDRKRPRLLRYSSTPVAWHPPWAQWVSLGSGPKGPSATWRVRIGRTPMQPLPAVRTWEVHRPRRRTPVKPVLPKSLRDRSPEGIRQSLVPKKAGKCADHAKGCEVSRCGCCHVFRREAGFSRQRRALAVPDRRAATQPSHQDLM